MDGADDGDSGNATGDDDDAADGDDGLEVDGADDDYGDYD